MVPVQDRSKQSTLYWSQDILRVFSYRFSFVTVALSHFKVPWHEIFAGSYFSDFAIFPTIRRNNPHPLPQEKKQTNKQKQNYRKHFPAQIFSRINIP